ncbi:Guanylate cyclase 32E [Lamellibrachia satsuma]|nr:Guanylate cyclase 32E [Lamellibrachia satsuma]
MHRRGYSPRNGTMLVEVAKMKTFEGKSGVVTFDAAGDRVANFTVWHLSGGDMKFKPMLEIIMSQNSPSFPHITVHEIRDWGITGMDAPRDKPTCGFYDELCPERKSDRMFIIVLSSILFVVAALPTTVVGIVLYRRHQLKRELDLMLWNVNYEDLVFVGERLNGSQTRSNVDVPNNETTLCADHTRRSVKLAVYRGNLVVARKLCSPPLVVTRSVEIQLMVMREINHDNLNQFIGICSNDGISFTLTKYCSKGKPSHSTQYDILENDNINLDNNFKNSLLSDLIRGMHGLHKSDIKSHGHLTSSCCVIDGRWVLQITDWGITRSTSRVYETAEARNRVCLRPFLHISCPSHSASDYIHL